MYSVGGQIRMKKRGFWKFAGGLAQELESVFESKK
jgi:hypothetical protein